jgi:hypothetical protein
VADGHNDRPETARCRPARGKTRSAPVKIIVTVLLASQCAGINCERVAKRTEKGISEKDRLMTYVFSPPIGGAIVASTIVLEAARGWRAARDAGHFVQPRLFQILLAHGCDVLAPVFDSLMALCESALGRRLRVGDGGTVSEDEHLLLELLDGSKHTRASLDCEDGIATALDCALCSTRFMMRLTLDQQRSLSVAPPLSAQPTAA